MITATSRENHSPGQESPKSPQSRQYSARRRCSSRSGYPPAQSRVSLRGTRIQSARYRNDSPADTVFVCSTLHAQEEPSLTRLVIFQSFQMIGVRYGHTRDRTVMFCSVYQFKEHCTGRCLEDILEKNC